MTKSNSEVLENIRSAIIRRDWEKRNEVLLLLLTKIGRQQAMELAVSYAEWYVPRFIQRNPTETWAETRLREVRKAMKVGFTNAGIPRIFPEYYKGFSDPLSRTFKGGAMYSLWAMIRPAADYDKSIEFARDAIANVLTIVRNEYRERMPSEYIKDGQRPRFDEFETDLWFRLVEKIEMILNQEFG